MNLYRNKENGNLYILYQNILSFPYCRFVAVPYFPNQGKEKVDVKLESFVVVAER